MQVTCWAWKKQPLGQVGTLFETKGQESRKKQPRGKLRKGGIEVDGWLKNKGDYLGRDSNVLLSR